MERNEKVPLIPQYKADTKKLEALLQLSYGRLRSSYIYPLAPAPITLKISAMICIAVWKADCAAEEMPSAELP